MVAKDIIGLHFTDEGLQLREDLIKHRNYLVDYSLIGERTHQEVRLWDKLFIYAAALGIADEFSDQIGQIREPISDSDYSHGYVRMRSFNNHSGLQRNIRSGYVRNVSSSSSGGSGGSSSSGGGGGSGGGTR